MKTTPEEARNKCRNVILAMNVGASVTDEWMEFVEFDYANGDGDSVGKSVWLDYYMYPHTNTPTTSKLLYEFNEWLKREMESKENHRILNFWRLGSQLVTQVDNKTITSDAAMKTLSECVHKMHELGDLQFATSVKRQQSENLEVDLEQWFQQHYKRTT